MAGVLAGHAADEAARPLEGDAGPSQAACGELGHAGGASVDADCGRSDSRPSRPLSVPWSGEVHRSGSAARIRRRATAVLGLLRLRLGALPEADAAARWRCACCRRATSDQGSRSRSPCSPTSAIEAGELGEAQALLDLLPQDDWPAGVGTVLIPAARGRLRLAQGRRRRRFADFRTLWGDVQPRCVWGTELRDVGYLHARTGAAAAAVRLDERDRGTRAGARRACRRAESLARRGHSGSRCASPALAEGGGTRARAARRVGGRAPPLAGGARAGAFRLADLGAAMRRAGIRAAARDPLTEALDLAARCGRVAARRPRASRSCGRTGARPRRAWAHRRRGADTERAARRAAGGPGTHQPARSRTSVRDPQDRRGATSRGPTESSGSRPRAALASRQRKKRPGCRPSSERRAATASLRST
jgi:hypothetical protein